jgi:uncharacterized protein
MPLYMTMLALYHQRITMQPRLVRETTGPARIHHARAKRWLDANIQFGWATCPITQNGMIRIMSQRSYPRASTTYDMALRLREATAEPTHTFLFDDISFTDPTRIQADSVLTAANTTDIYLLALAVSHNARFVTFDHGVSLRAVVGATEPHLVKL